MFLYVEQDVNVQVLKFKKIAQKNFINEGKSCFAVRKEWVKHCTVLRMISRQVPPVI